MSESQKRCKHQQTHKDQEVSASDETPPLLGDDIIIWRWRTSAVLRTASAPQTAPPTGWGQQVDSAGRVPRQNGGKTLINIDRKWLDIYLKTWESTCWPWLQGGTPRCLQVTMPDHNGGNLSRFSPREANAAWEGTLKIFVMNINLFSLPLGSLSFWRLKTE